MSKKTIKNLMLFLFANLVIALIIIINHSFDKNKVDNVKLANAEVPQQYPQPQNINTETNQATYQNAPQNSNHSISNQAIVSTTPLIVPQKPLVQTSPEEPSVCIVMGPFNLEEKGTLDFILSKSKEHKLATFEKRTPYQIYWDLGSDLKKAEELFANQSKNGGPMSDPKFEISQNSNGNWIVNITQIRGNKAVVEKLTKDLAAKASKINAGGEWKYEIAKESYYYTFKQFNKLSDSTVKNIDVLLKPKKDPC